MVKCKKKQFDKGVVNEKNTDFSLLNSHLHLIHDFLFYSLVTDEDSQITYKVSQFNMVAHGTDSVDDDTDNGEITRWVSVIELNMT